MPELWQEHAQNSSISHTPSHVPAFVSSTTLYPRHPPLSTGQMEIAVLRYYLNYLPYILCHFNVQILQNTYLCQWWLIQLLEKTPQHYKFRKYYYPKTPNPIYAVLIQKLTLI